MKKFKPGDRVRITNSCDRCYDSYGDVIGTVIYSGSEETEIITENGDDFGVCTSTLVYYHCNKSKIIKQEST